MKNINLKLLIDLLSNNWGYFGSVIFGAITSAFIVHNFTKRREKERLKFDVQIKAADQLLECVKMFLDASGGMFINCISLFERFNDTLEMFPMLPEELGENFGNNRIINNISRNQIEHAKENIYSNMNNYLDVWQTYTKSFVAIISILESKEVIFNRFVGFRNLLLDEFNSISNIHSNITNLYFLVISPIVSSSNHIEKSKLERLYEYEDNFRVKRFEISSILWDLRVGIQNEFLGKLYNYKVPLRQPTDKRYSVYKPGYVHKKENNN